MSPKIVTCFLKMWPGFLKKWPGFLIRGLLNFMENQVLGSHFWESGSHFWETGSHFWETGSNFWETGSPIRIRSHSWDTIGNPFHKFQVISEKPGHIFRRLAVTLFLNLKFHILLTWWVLQYDLELISIIKKSKIKFKYPFKDKRPLRNICKTIYIHICMSAEYPLDRRKKRQKEEYAFLSDSVLDMLGTWDRSMIGAQRRAEENRQLTKSSLRA